MKKMRPSSLTIPSSPVHLFAARSLRASYTSHGSVILFSCEYEKNWNTQTRAVYYSINGERTNYDIARLLNSNPEEIRKEMSLLYLLGLIDLVDVAKNQPIQFDTYFIRRSIELALAQKDTFVQSFYESMLHTCNIGIQREQHLVSFLRFIAYGGTTKQPYYKTLQDFGRKNKANGIGDEEYTTIAFAFFTAMQHVLRSWWTEVREYAWRDIFMIITDVMMLA